MNKIIENLVNQLTNCENKIREGYTRTKLTEFSWLNDCCAKFLIFANEFQKLLYVNKILESSESIESIYLCLTQIVTCIRYVEHTIAIENTEGTEVSLSRQHFLDRIIWCVESTKTSLRKLELGQHEKLNKEDLNIVQLTDEALDLLAPYSACKESRDKDIISQTKSVSKQVRSIIDQFLGHVLAFANVALESDKKAISALCQKVLRECIAFQEECCSSQVVNQSNLKLLAMSLENAMQQLENYINEALLRLAFTTFLDHSKFSIQRLRNDIQMVNGNDNTQLDELIADFDVNVDRMTQIGLFAIAFAPNIKVKIKIRSCLASLESLDSCVIPSLQSSHKIYANILEQHFNEEVANFQQIIQKIIDSQTLCGCYCEIITDCIVKTDKTFNKNHLDDILQMGLILQKHFQIKVNYLELSKNVDAKELFNKFLIMLSECQAILLCANQVEHSRILKRFKILRSIIIKFHHCISKGLSNRKRTESDIFQMTTDASDTNHFLGSAGILPSQRSVLYKTDAGLRKRTASDSLAANYSKLQISSKQIVPNNSKACDFKKSLPMHLNKIQELRKSVQRKQSLRTTMFKRQKSMESESIYQTYRESSYSLQITDILDQLTSLSVNISKPIATKNT